jgi:hypothetical protein
MQVSGGDGFNMVFVSVDIPNSSLAAQIANLVGRLMNGQMDPGSFAQAINDAGGNIVQYMYVAPSQQGFPPPPCP